MASTEMTVMPVILAKFKPRLEIGDYQRIGLNDRSSVLLLLRGDGDLFARTLVHGEINATRKLMSKVRRRVARLVHSIYAMLLSCQYADSPGRRATEMTRLFGFRYWQMTGRCLSMK